VDLRELPAHSLSCASIEDVLSRLESVNATDDASVRQRVTEFRAYPIARPTPNVGISEGGSGEHRRLNRFGEGHVHGVVGADVVAQPTHDPADRGVGDVEIAVGEIGNRFVRTAGRARPGLVPFCLASLQVRLRPATSHRLQ
jgi:hypothetical protein